MPVDSMKYDPLDYYKNTLKDAFSANCEQFLNNVTNESKVDIGANEVTSNKIVAQNKKIEEQKDRLKDAKALRIFLIILSIIGIALIIVGALLIAQQTNQLVGIILIPVGIIVFIIPLVVIFTKVNKKIDALSDCLDAFNKELQGLLDEARVQLSPFFNSLKFDDFINICNMTTSMFKLDKELVPEKLLLLKGLYGYVDGFTEDESITDVMSGEIDTNPFIRCKIIDMKMIDKVYTGSRVVTWTETYRDSEGRTQTRQCSETLVARITRKAPEYTTEDYLIYGNEAAPDLKFIRGPSGIKVGCTDKDVDKFVKSEEKRLNKMNEKATKAGGTFQALGNTKFDALFGAYDRNNEVQFRLLFTPLAQQNMIELITKAQPYGDDWSFFKNKKINIVSSFHGQKYFEYDPRFVFSYYDFKNVVASLKAYFENLFASLYFELAPLLSIPLYQMTDAGKYDVKQNLRNVSDYEAESFVNHMDPKLFAHPSTKTTQILKINFKNSVSKSDVFEVTSHSFDEIPQVEQVSVMCRNGKSYIVDVPWFRYDPLSQVSSIAIKNNLNRDNSCVNSSNYISKNFIGFYMDNVYNDDNQEKEFDLADYLEKKFDNLN